MNTMNFQPEDKIIKIKIKRKKNKVGGPVSNIVKEKVEVPLQTKLNIKKSVVDTFDKNNFVYFGIHLSAFTNNNGEIKKQAILPCGYMDIQAPLIKPVYDKKTKTMIDPNGFSILTEQSNISIIDVDKPEDCPIVDKLLIDCQYIHKTRKGYHFIFKKNDLPKARLCGDIDINTNLINFVPEYKHIDTNEIIGKYEMIKTEALTDMPDYAYQYCQERIKCCYGGGPVSNITKKKIKVTLQQDRPETNKLNLDIMNECYKIHFEANSFYGFSDWLKLGYCGRHCNNTEEGFQLFLKYSRLQKGYENEPEETIRSHFYNGQYILDFDEIGFLLQTRKKSKDKFLKYIDPLLKSSNTLPSKHFNRKYIYPNPTDSDYEPEIKKFNSFIDKSNPLKLLAFSSPYGTGKTHTFKKLIQNFESVLFLTYRQSLAMSLYTELKEEYGFDNYKELTNEEIKKSKRLILQLDSLPRLQEDQDSITGQIQKLQKYDLIVLDESEGLLSHFNATTLKDKEQTFNILFKLCDTSNKILVCDGDLAERSFDFIDKTLQCQYDIYINDFKPTKRNIIFTREQEGFENNIKKDLKNNKKIVICCMLATDTMKYKAMFDKDYNVLVHNGSEKNKQKLINYKEEWAKVDLLIYSPTIEAGVDFDFEYFDKQYGCMSDKSTSARAFSQMLHRVRQFKDNEIQIFIGNLKYSPHDFLYYPRTIEKCYFSEYDTYKGLSNIQLHNKVEQLNTLNFVISDFIRIIKRKGYSFKFVNQRTKAEEFDYETRKEGISKIGVLSYYDYQDLIEKQNKGDCLTQEEVYHLDKFYMSYKFHIPVEDITEDFIDTHFRKESIIDTYNAVMGTQEENNPLPNRSLDNNFIADKIDVWNPIFKLLQEPIKKTDIIDKLNDIIQSKKTKQLFSSLPKTNSHRQTIKNINNHILNEFGVSIIQERKQYRKDGKKIEYINLYIQNGDILQGYIDRRAEECLIEE